jgi:hypothetical protein
MHPFCSFFSFAYFSNFKFTSHKKKHENRLERESVLSREGSLNFSHKEREKREREHSRETFIEQNRKRGLIEIDTEREKKPFSHPFFFPFQALFARNFEFKKYSRGNDVDERDGVEGNRETR